MTTTLRPVRAKGRLSINDTREVQWDQSHNWSISISDLPNVNKDRHNSLRRESYLKLTGGKSPKRILDLTSFIPATDVSITFATGNSHVFSTSLRDFSIPTGVSGGESLSITVLDDYLNSFWWFMKSWFDSTYPNINSVYDNANKSSSSINMGVASLDECIKIITIVKLSPEGLPLYSFNTWVYPEGGLSFSGTSTSETSTQSYQFKIINIQMQKIDSANVALS